MDELIVGVGIALGQRPLDDCLAFDREGDGVAGIGELMAGVDSP